MTELPEPALPRSGLILVDGPAGSGKTTFAATVGAPVVHLDDLYAGWAGMAAGLAQGRAVTAAFLAGRPVRYRRFDWHAHDWAEWVSVPHDGLLVVEGCGAGALCRAGFLVWVEAEEQIRMTRGLSRDGEEFEDQWIAWQATENAHFVSDRTRERADLIVRT